MIAQAPPPSKDSIRKVIFSSASTLASGLVAYAGIETMAVLGDRSGLVESVDNLSCMDPIVLGRRKVVAELFPGEGTSSHPDKNNLGGNAEIQGQLRMLDET